MVLTFQCEIGIVQHLGLGGTGYVVPAGADNRWCGQKSSAEKSAAGNEPGMGAALSWAAPLLFAATLNSGNLHMIFA